MSTIRYRTILSLLSITFLSVFSAFSQIYSVDSLETALAVHTRIDTAKVNLLNKLAYELHRRDPKKAISYAGQSQKMADQAGVCNYLLAIGNAAQGLGDVKASNQAYDRALQIASTLKEPSIYIKHRK